MLHVLFEAVAMHRLFAVAGCKKSIEKNTACVTITLFGIDSCAVVL